MTTIAQWPLLLGHILRRDRVALPVWILAVTAFAVLFAPAMPAIVGSPEEIAALSEMLRNPAMVAMCGIIYGDVSTIGIIFTQMMLVWTAILVAVMNILIVVRHTRSDEDDGRLEVIWSLPVGRLANLVAVAVLMTGVNVALALLTGFGMASFGVESIDLAGSLVYAAALGACGLVFAGLTMVVVQLVSSARGATGLGLVLLGGFYLLRAYGDVSSEAAARLSPLGLIQRTFPFYANRWWPVAVLTAAGLVLMAAACALNSLRDLGQGLMPSLRPRRAHASAFLAGEWGLAWRLTRGTVIAWGAAVFVLSAAYGSVMGNMEDFIASSSLYQQMMGVGADATDIVGPVVSMLLLIMSICGAIPVLTTAFKLVSEERKGRMDYVLGKTVSRTRVFAGYAGLAALVAVAMQALAAVGFWVVARQTMADPVALSLVVKVAFNYGAPLIAFGGLGLFLVGWAKRATWVAWAYLVVAFLVVYIGGMLNPPRWVARLVPFGMVQRWPTEAFSWWPWIGLVLAGVALAVLGAVGYGRRDVTA